VVLGVTRTQRRVCYQGPAAAGTLSYRVPARCGRQLPERTPRLHMTAPNPRSNANCLWGIADAIFHVAAAARRGSGAHQSGDAGRQRGHEPRRRALDGAGPSIPPRRLRSATGGVGRKATTFWPIPWTTWASSHRTCWISSERRSARHDPRLVHSLIPRWPAIRIAIGIPLTCDRYLP